MPNGGCVLRRPWTIWIWGLVILALNRRQTIQICQCVQFGGPIGWQAWFEDGLERHLLGLRTDLALVRINEVKPEAKERIGDLIANLALGNGVVFYGMALPNVADAFELLEVIVQVVRIPAQLSP